MLYLVVYHPQTMMSARVNGSPSRGATSIPVDNVVQFKAPFTHAHVIFGSTPGGSDYGDARFKNYASGTLTIGANNVLAPDDAYVTVLEEIKPRSLIPYVSSGGVTTEDGGTISYNDQNTNYHPLARMGPPAVGFLSGGSATVKFWSNSVAIATGASLSSYAWTFPNGSPPSSTNAGTVSNPISVTWTQAGQYYVSLQVTDSNGKTHTAYRPVFIVDRDNKSLYYENIEISSWEGDVEAGGWQCALKVWGTADKTQFPDQALIVLAAEDWFGDEKVSLGGDYTYRENITFVGYIRRGSVKKDFKANAVEFQAEGIGRLMDNILAWPANLKAANSPAGWHELSGMTCDRAAFHIITEHSTLDHICDIDLSTPAYSLKYMDITESSLHDQLGSQLYTAVRSRIGSSRTGILYARVNPQLTAAADRTQPIVMAVTKDDLREEVDLGPEQHEKQVSQVDFIGFKYTGQDFDPIYALAPAKQWPTGKVERIDGVRADSQDEANTFAGYFEGWKNNSYGEVTFNWRGNYRVFDVFPHEKIIFSLAANDNARGISWENQVFWHKRVAFEYKSGYLLANSVVESDIAGNAGITGDYPPTPAPPPGPPPPPPPPSPPPGPEPPPWPDGPEPTPRSWRAKIYMAFRDKGVYYTSNFTGVGGTMPTWTAVNGGIPNYGDAGVSTTFYHLTADAFKPSQYQYLLAWQRKSGVGDRTLVLRRLGTGNWTVIAFIADSGFEPGSGTNLKSVLTAPFTATIIRPIEGPLTRTITSITFAASGLDASNPPWITADINAAGYLAAPAGARLGFVDGSIDAVVWFYSTNYGADWHYASTTLPQHQTSLTNVQTGFHGASNIRYFTNQIGWFYGDPNYFWRSDDGGVTWNWYAFSSPRCRAYQQDAHGTTLYRWQLNPLDSYPQLQRSADKGVTWSALVPYDGTKFLTSGGGTFGGYNHYVGYRKVFAIYRSGQSARIIRAVFSANPDGTGQHSLWKSEDSGATWVKKSDIPTTTVEGYNFYDMFTPIGICMCHDADGKIYLISDGLACKIAASENDGATLYGKAGYNYQTPPYTDSIPQDAGPVVSFIAVYA